MRYFEIVESSSIPKLTLKNLSALKLAKLARKKERESNLKVVKLMYGQNSQHQLEQQELESSRKEFDIEKQEVELELEFERQKLEIERSTSEILMDIEKAKLIQSDKDHIRKNAERYLKQKQLI
jgi:hypothetical protein